MGEPTSLQDKKGTGFEWDKVMDDLPEEKTTELGHLWGLHAL